MRLSGVEIQTFCPAGIGSPSVGAGRRRPLTTIVGPVDGPLEALGGAGEGALKYDLLSCSQTVFDTPAAYVPGWVRTASTPALRSTE